MPRTPQIPALPGCTPLGLPPLRRRIVECSSSKAERVMADPCASFWLQDALRGSLNRDCVDALADAECLVAILRQRCTENGISCKAEA